MDESKKYAAQTATYSPQPLKPIHSAAAEGYGTPHTVRTSTDSPNHAPIAAGGYSASPLAHVSTVSPSSAQYQLPVGSGSVPGSHLGRDSSSPALPRGDRVQLRTDGGSSGAYVYQVQANSSANHPPVNAPTWSTQTSGPENKVLNHASVKVEGTAGMSKPAMSPLAARDQNSRLFTSQPSPGGEQASPKVRFVQTSSLPNNHNEIAKIIQKLLQPQLPDHPTWIPPSRDYMSKALTCQTCQISITEVDNVLICDACEKGYHITCAQSPNQRGIPRGEWHCTRCLSLSNGKPLPPKYGRVMRSNIQLKAPSSMVPSSTVASSTVASSTVAPGTIPSSTAVVQMSSENKVGALDQKAFEQKISAHVSTVPQNPAHAVGLGTNNIKSEIDSKVSSAKEMQGNMLPSSSINTDEKPSSKQIGNPEFSELDGKPSESRAEPSSDFSNKDGDPKISTASETEGNKFPSSSNNMDEKTLSGNLLSGERTSPLRDTSESAKSDERPFESSAEPPADLCNKDSDPNISGATETQGNNIPSSSQSADEKPLSGEIDNSEPSRSFESNADPPSDLSNKEAHSNISNAKDMQGPPNCGEDSSCSIIDDQVIPKQNTSENLGVSGGTLEHTRSISDDVRPVEWIGDSIQVVSEKQFYGSCCIDGVTYELQEHALFQSSDGKLIPFKLQSMWENMKNGSKWVMVKSCYFPNDLPENVDRPSTPESDEVYESSHESTVMAGLIQGPCEVLHHAKFSEEIERRGQLGADTSNGLPPVFLCKWSYDESKGLFQPVS